MAEAAVGKPVLPLSFITDDVDFLPCQNKDRTRNKSAREKNPLKGMRENEKMKAAHSSDERAEPSLRNEEILTIFPLCIFFINVFSFLSNFRPLAARM